MTTRPDRSLAGRRHAPNGTLVRILGLSGSLRRGSSNSALLQAAASLAPAGVEVFIGSIRDLPLYDPDLELDPPAAVRAFKAAAEAADAFLLATPEYNHSVPGTLKNAVDWLSRPRLGPLLAGKPVAMMGSGGMLGTARAQLAWLPIFAEVGLVAVAQPAIYVVMGRGLGPDGAVLDAALRERLRDKVESLALAVRDARSLAAARAVASAA